MSSVHSRRKSRRDRSAQQAAWLLISVMALLSIGGAVRITGLDRYFHGNRDVGPLFRVDESTAGVTSVRVHPMVAETNLAREAVEPMTVKPLAAPVAPEPAPAPAQAAPPAAEPEPRGPTYDGRPIKPVRTIRMLVTAYSPDERSCGRFADNITASGYSVWTNGMKLVAADTRLLPFRTIISVPGYNGGKPVPVLDRGGKIKGRRLDVLYPTHAIAKRWGARWLTVTVWDYAD